MSVIVPIWSVPPLTGCAVGAVSAAAGGGVLTTPLVLETGVELGDVGVAGGELFEAADAQAACRLIPMAPPASAGPVDGTSSRSRSRSRTVP